MSGRREHHHSHDPKPLRLEWLFPLRGRWLTYLGIGVVIHLIAWGCVEAYRELGPLTGGAVALGAVLSLFLACLVHLFQGSLAGKKARRRGISSDTILMGIIAICTIILLLLVFVYDNTCSVRC